MKQRPGQQPFAQGRQRSEQGGRIRDEIHARIVNRVAQREHRLYVALDHEIAREEQRIAVIGAVDESQEGQQGSGNPDRNAGGKAPYRDQARRFRVRRQHERKWQIGRLEPKALVRMLAEPLKNMRMARHPRPPDDDGGDEINVGVYRMQVIGRDRAIMRWLAHRGGARHHHRWQSRGADMPVAVAIGADPATILSAVLPLPETLSEFRFAGLIRGERLRLSPCITVPLMAPADAEIVIEGLVSPDETAPEGPFGDHTGYYNAVEHFPVMRVTAVTMRRNPVYLSTFTGRPPDEPSRIGEVLNELFVPLVRKQLPEIVDLWLPPDACSYRVAIASIDKRHPGQARRIMLALWSLLPQLTYTKFLIVVDADINVRRWADVVWAISTRSDPSRDLVTLTDTPIDYLDFASPKAGLGGKLGIDATRKTGAETTREWGRVLEMDAAVVTRVDELWQRLGLTQMLSQGALSQGRAP